MQHTLRDLLKTGSHICGERKVRDPMDAAGKSFVCVWRTRYQTLRFESCRVLVVVIVIKSGDGDVKSGSKDGAQEGGRF